ncbi:prophage protein [Escherichia coli]|uniref:Prophage protein n=1 Tax=Escherichia coli TaxID=562 RepID=A0A2X1JQB2_ECOLX|nr:prophage protein [Escherichia coli]STJ11336.1 prophage protein [Escherichia coli]
MNQNDIEAMIQRYTEAEMAVLDGNPSPLMVSR